MHLAVIYARYSSHNQRDVSIEQQVNACRKYAEENNLDVIRIYADHAMTGTNDNRPEFQRMLRDSASRAFHYVIVYTLDRFSRDRYDSAVHKHTLKTYGVKVLSAMENIQDNPTGVLMESILEGFAEYYSKELAQKIRRGMNSNAEKCLVIGPLPYGYCRGADGRYEIIPAEAAVVREIFSRVASGEALIDICRDLNARGFQTKHGKPWDRSSFNRLLHNERYVGVYTSAGQRIEGGVPAIVDRAVFNQVQEHCRQKPNPRGPQKRRRSSGVYLLTGKLYCGECKSPMVGISGTGKHGELHSYYACKSRRSGCHKRPVRRDYAEALIAQHIVGMISSPRVASWLADQVVAYLRSNQDSDEIRMLEVCGVYANPGESGGGRRFGVVDVEGDVDFCGRLAGEIGDQGEMIVVEVGADEECIDQLLLVVFVVDVAGAEDLDEGQDVLAGDVGFEAVAGEGQLGLKGGFLSFEIGQHLGDAGGEYAHADRAEGVFLFGGDDGETILHQIHLIRTSEIYLVCGLFVLVSQIADLK